MLSKKGRYAVKALINLARCAPASKGVRCIAEQERIPRRFLEVILSELRRAGLVESSRGKTGGFRLARPANLITFADIMRLTDGPLAMLPCVSRNFYQRCDDCDEASCALRRVLGIVRDQVSDVLDRTTLAHAVAGGGPAILSTLADVA